jgi:uncharacterized protein YneF (UPF0154 family)
MIDLFLGIIIGLLFGLLLGYLWRIKYEEKHFQFIDSNLPIEESGSNEDGGYVRFEDGTTMPVSKLRKFKDLPPLSEEEIENIKNSQRLPPFLKKKETKKKK